MTIIVPTIQTSQGLRLGGAPVASLMTPEQSDAFRAWLPGLDREADLRMTRLAVRTSTPLNWFEFHGLDGMRDFRPGGVTLRLPESFDDDRPDAIPLTDVADEAGAMLVETGPDTLTFTGRRFAVLGTDVHATLALDPKDAPGLAGRESWTARLDGAPTTFFRVAGAERVFRAPMIDVRTLGAGDWEVRVVFTDGLATEAFVGAVRVVPGGEAD
jgi:hypothetical protein